ncbi:Txe/YoeB family addiction module toxin [Succinatimonas hippei]|uniref:Txe/YoeB family addiction module toxin n=1 Tax=Succinatimonas hippei TaxID=626938 RepID=UPI0026EC9612|nr:Txe/YoeB family addiction module toxin [Succinatimonas hippei]
MILSWHTAAWEDYLYWQQTDKKTLRKINSLIRETLRHPTEGNGNPEALKHELSGAWSRRIDREHRLVYVFTESTVTILSCKTHYE